jgi:hypothetical protein
MNRIGRRIIVAWVSRGMLRPTGDDFAMLRLILLALLPQIGGILLMVGRLPNSGDPRSSLVHRNAPQP